MPTRILKLNREIHAMQQKPQSHSCSKKNSSLKPNAGLWLPFDVCEKSSRQLSGCFAYGEVGWSRLGCQAAYGEGDLFGREVLMGWDGGLEEGGFEVGCTVETLWVIGMGWKWVVIGLAEDGWRELWGMWKLFGG